MTYLHLIISFLKIGLLGFGGGMAIISLIQHEVEVNGWMTEAEFVDIVGISQVTPGPIGMNCATYVGYTATGSVWGSVVATIAMIIPGLIIMLSICRVYDMIRSRWQDNKVFKGVMRIIRLLVVVLIAHAAWALMTPESFIDMASYAIFGVVVILSILPMWKYQDKRTQKVTDIISHPILLIALSGLVGLVLYY